MGINSVYSHILANVLAENGNYDMKLETETDKTSTNNIRQLQHDLHKFLKSLKEFSYNLEILLPKNFGAHLDRWPHFFLRSGRFGSRRNPIYRLSTGAEMELLAQARC